MTIVHVLDAYNVIFTMYTSSQFINCWTADVQDGCLVSSPLRLHLVIVVVLSQFLPTKRQCLRRQL